MKVLALYNLKGGVGKTTAAVCLAQAAARSGRRTLLWDLDPQAASTHILGGALAGPVSAKSLARGKADLSELVRPGGQDRLDLVGADFSLRHLDLHLEDAKKPGKALRRLLEPLAKRYELCFLDCAPSISLTSEGVFRASDALLVPVVPSPLSMGALEQLASHLARDGHADLPVWPFFNLVDRRKALHRRLAEEREGLPLPFLATAIPYAAAAEQMGVHGRPLADYAPHSPATAAYEALWAEVLERVNGLGSSRI